MNDPMIGERPINTADQVEKRALMQMQTLADSVGFEHIHHAPIADEPNKVKGFPQDAFMDMGMDKAKTVAKPEKYRPGSELECHGYGHDEPGASAAAGPRNW